MDKIAAVVPVNDRDFHNGNQRAVVQCYLTVDKYVAKNLKLQLRVFFCGLPEETKWDGECPRRKREFHGREMVESGG